MRNIKRFISALICLTVVLSTVPSMAFVSSANTSDGFEYTVNDDGVTATITQYTGNESDLTIPDTIDGYSTTAIGDWSFEWCSSLTSVIIPDSVTSIGYGAFYGCSSLTSVEIPDSVTSIGNIAFLFCENLTEISVATGNTVYSSSDGVLFNKDKSELMVFPAGKGKSYVMPDGVTSIGESAFFNCISLTSVTMPDSVTNIEKWAFNGCESLTSVTIPEGVKSIGEEAFAFCSKLTEISVASGNTVYSSSDGVLFNKDKSELVFFPAGKEGDYVIPDSVTSIGDSAFYHCRALTSVIIPDSVTSIGVRAFEECESLTFVEMSDRITSIGEGTFCSCGALTSVEIPDSVTSIGDSAFSGCGALTSVTIPDRVTSIGNWVFEFCSALTFVAIPDSITYIGDSAFSYCSKLCHVFYESGEENWNNIEIDIDGNGSLTSATRHYNATGDELMLVIEEPTFTYEGYNHLYCTECESIIFTQNIEKVENPFIDVDINAWYSKPVSFALYFNIFSGMSPTTFEPNSSMTRAMFVTVLGRLDGAVNDKNKGTVFTDVPTGEWYSGYIAWAAENKIVSGTSPTTFAPNSNITRQEMCVIMNNYCKYAGITLTPQVEKKTFLDSQDVAGWAKNAVEICQLAGLVSGKTETKQGVYFEPLGKATRAEVATILRKFCLNF